MSNDTITYRGAKGSLKESDEKQNRENPEDINYRGAKGKLTREEREKVEREIQYRGAKSTEKV